METLYTNEVREFINTRPWPVQLKFMVVEYIEPEPYLQFVMFRDNFNPIETAGKLQIAGMINEMFLSLRNKGVPIYLEMRKSIHDS